VLPIEDRTVVAHVIPDPLTTDSGIVLLNDNVREAARSRRGETADGGACEVRRQWLDRRSTVTVLRRA
jgi:hypothetical protein